MAFRDSSPTKTRRVATLSCVGAISYRFVLHRKEEEQTETSYIMPVPIAGDSPGAPLDTAGKLPSRTTFDGTVPARPTTSSYSDYNELLSKGPEAQLPSATKAGSPPASPTDPPTGVVAFFRRHYGAQLMLLVGVPLVIMLFVVAIVAIVRAISRKHTQDPRCYLKRGIKPPVQCTFLCNWKSATAGGKTTLSLAGEAQNPQNNCQCDKDETISCEGGSISCSDIAACPP